ncbi:MAG: recombinase family protein [Actinomycetota bacterium]|nr:recombinase family protein [Actinomycetota bacterium]
MAERDIYVDYASGARASRPQLDAVLRMLREGDALKLTRLDRLGRSVLHRVTPLGAQLRERGAGLNLIEQGIDTARPSASPSSSASRSSPNTRDGLAAARARTSGWSPTQAQRRAGRPTRGSSTTPASAPSSRSQISSAFPAPRSTGTWTPIAKASAQQPKGARNRPAGVATS